MASANLPPELQEDVFIGEINENSLHKLMQADIWGIGMVFFEVIGKIKSLNQLALSSFANGRE